MLASQSLRSIGFAITILIITIGVAGVPVDAATTTSVTASDVFIATNQERHDQGLPLLSENTILTRVAVRKMSDLFAKQYFAHESPTGESVADLAEEEGYEYITVGENLALGSFHSGAAVVEAWMASPGHRANILNTAYTDIGIAAGRSMYEGKNLWIVVQSFGLPRSSCPGPDVALKTSLKVAKNKLDFLMTVATYRKKLLTNRDVARSLYEVRVEQYNHAASLYNDAAAAYRTLARRYNRLTARFNACVMEKVPDHS